MAVRDDVFEEVVLERGAFVGTGAVVLPGVTVGEDAVVGAGVTGTDDVRPGRCDASLSDRRHGIANHRSAPAPTTTSTAPNASHRPVVFDSAAVTESTSPFATNPPGASQRITVSP